MATLTRILGMAIANILDWGLIVRKPKIDEALDTLVKRCTFKEDE